MIQAPELDFYGLHFHVGSQLSDNRSHLAAVDAALALVQTIHERFDYWIKELNVGGGFGVRYTDADIRQPYSYFLDPVMEKSTPFMRSTRANVRPSLLNLGAVSSQKQVSVCTPSAVSRHCRESEHTPALTVA